MSHTDATFKDGKIMVEKKYTLFQRIYRLPYLLYAYWRSRPNPRQDREFGDFILKHKKLLIIIADPKTDRLIMSYGGKTVVNQIRTADGRRTNIVKKVLKNGTFKGKVDQFLTSIIESLQVKVEDGNLFYQWIDGAIYNIAKALGKNS